MGGKRGGSLRILCNKKDPVPQKRNVTSTSACFFPCCPYALHPPFFSPFQTLKSDFTYPLQIRGSSEVVEVEFPWQTSTEHQHRIYKYVLISIHCKISPTMSRAWKQVVSTDSTAGLDPWNVVSYLITSYLIHSSNLSANSTGSECPSRVPQRYSGCFSSGLTSTGHAPSFALEGYSLGSQVPSWLSDLLAVHSLLSLEPSCIPVPRGRSWAGGSVPSWSAMFCSAPAWGCGTGSVPNPGSWEEFLRWQWHRGQVSWTYSHFLRQPAWKKWLQGVITADFMSW